MNLGGVIPTTLEVTVNHLFQSLSLDIWPGKTSRVEQHIPYIPGKGIPVPRSEMEDLVSPQEQTFKMKC